MHGTENEVIVAPRGAQIFLCLEAEAPNPSVQDRRLGQWINKSRCHVNILASCDSSDLCYLFMITFLQAAVILIKTSTPGAF